MRIVAFFLIFVISGCATLNQDHPRKKHSLSEAIETGNTGGSTRVHSDDDENIWALFAAISEDENDPSDNHELKRAYEQEGENNKSLIFLFDVSRSLNVSKQIDDISRYSLIVGDREEHFSFLFHIAITDYDFKEDWPYYNELKNPWALEAGLASQYCFTKKKNFIQPYIKAGFAYGEMDWEYANSIYDLETGEGITKDSSGYLRLFGAFGIAFRLNDSFDLSVDLQKDYTIYSETTGQGFEDDILSDFGATMFGANLIWHF